MRTLDGLAKALLVLAIMSSAACGSSAPSRFYTLSAEAVTGSATAGRTSGMSRATSAHLKACFSLLWIETDGYMYSRIRPICTESIRPDS